MTKNDTNSGNYNSDYRNSGNDNSGYYNSGDYNSGDYNCGNNNSGDYNSGDYNCGKNNSGDYNSGNYNSGYRNSGNNNSGYRNSGVFNTGTPDKIMVFNKWLDMSFDEFNDKYPTNMDIPLNRWVNICELSTEEIDSIKGCREMGGYLKTLPFKEACVIWWNENPNKHQLFTSLPNFDAAIFKEITGIDIESKTEEMTLEEVCKQLGKTIKIIK